MKSHGYVLTLLLGAFLVLVAVNVLARIVPNESAASTFGLMIAVVFALFLNAMHRKQSK